MIFLFLARHFLPSSSKFGRWTSKSSSKNAGRALNDINLSAAGHMKPLQLSNTEAAIEHGQIVSPSKRFIPLSAPAGGSVAS